MVQVEGFVWYNTCMNDVELKQVLWDIDPTRISEMPDSFIIRRVLAYGTVGLIFKLLQIHGRDMVCAEFESMKVTSMNPKRHQYLKELLPLLE